MAMKEAEREGAGRSPRERLRQPLEEGRSRREGSFYFHLREPENAAALFKGLEAQLASGGYSCVRGSLQSEPHPHLSILDSFDVYLPQGSRRSPELFGTATLYGERGNGGPQPRCMKITPVYPADDETFIKALALALEGSLPQGGADVSMALTYGPEHSFPK